MFRCKIVSFAILMLIASAPYALAAPGDLLKTIEPPTPTANYFGLSVVTTSQQLLVRGYDNTATTTASGMVAMYDRNFTYQKTLTAPVPETNDNFGSPVVVSGQSLYIADSMKTVRGMPRAGVMYKYSLRTGALIATTENPDPQAEDRFGFNCAATSKYLAIGAYNESTQASHAGAAYLFDARTSQLRASLFSPLQLKDQWFGDSVAISGNTILVGADGATNFGEAAGAIYAFDARTGQLLQSVQSPEPQVGGLFGYPIVVTPRYILTSADGQDDVTTGAGVVYVLDAKTRALVRKIRNPQPGFKDTFGQAMAVKGNLLLVGAPYDSTDATRNGIVHLMDLNTGALLLTLHEPQPYAGGYGSFGRAVQFMGNKLVVGAYGNTGVDPNSRGRVYVFEGMKK